MKNRDNKLRPEQLAAIKTGINLGRTLQKDHPKIANLYRQNRTLPKIAEELNIQEEYGVGYNVASNGVQKAISGHDGSFGIDSYNGLMEEGEKIMISKKNVQEAFRNIFKKSYREKTGIFGRTSKQHSEDGKKGAQRAAIARGFTLWTEDEISLAYQLSQQSAYKWGKGSHEGKTNIKRISKELIRRGYSYRTNDSLHSIIWKRRKSLEDKV